LHSKNKTFFSEQEIWITISQIARGLKVLHDMKILHRDIKCSNIFVTKENNYKLGDLNVSKQAAQGLAYTQTGTPYYASPEVWRDESYDIKSDIWSLGCIFYEMC
jgi:NIMA (never in mitosis gene a)-related kinase